MSTLLQQPLLLSMLKRHHIDNKQAFSNQCKQYVETHRLLLSCEDMHMQAEHSSTAAPIAQSDDSASAHAVEDLSLGSSESSQSLAELTSFLSFLRHAHCLHLHTKICTHRLSTMLQQLQGLLHLLIQLALMTP